MNEHPLAKSYTDLPEHIRLFLEQLDTEDITSIKEGIHLARATKTMGRFWKWTFIFIVAAFGGMATIGQSVQWLFQWLRGEA